MFLSCQCQCALFSAWQYVCVTSAGNESHPPIADEDKGTDRLYGLTEATLLENIQSSKLFALFPKWVTMIDRSEPTASCK